MRLSKTRLFLIGLGAGVGVYALSAPAFSQDAPQSLLPEGFGDPVAPAPPAPAAPSPSTPAPSRTAPAAPAPPLSESSVAQSAPSDEGEDVAGEDALDELDMALDFDDIPPEYELPAGARRSLAKVGPLTLRNGGYGENAFAGINGRFFSTLMRRLDAPGPSRWLHISLRRALLSEIPTPDGVSAPDWVAERAWLLLRMGEVDGARMLVQRVDSDRYTPKLYAVAMQVGLANGDPASFCPLVSGARQTVDSPGWVLAEAICAGLVGESVRATAQTTAARRNGITNGFDILLAERVANAGGSSRAVTIEWNGVERLNAWRFGMANAVGETIPVELYQTSGRQVAAWRARSPTIDLADRIEPARTAAVMGVFSNQTLVSMYSALLPDLDPDEVAGSPTGNLRAAYVRSDLDDRMSALQALWADTGGRDDRYAGLILSARAAARIAPSASLANQAGSLIAAMMSAGLDIQAAGWAATVADADQDDADQAWALLAVGAPEPVVESGYGRVDDYVGRAGSDGRHRAQLLAAALAGLGRLDSGEISDANDDLALGLDVENVWTRQIDRAARTRRVGVVALLAAVGMQSPNWSGIPPSHLYHVVRAYRLAGREPEARMIAAEAITRS